MLSEMHQDVAISPESELFYFTVTIMRNITQAEVPYGCKCHGCGSAVGKQCEFIQPYHTSTKDENIFTFTFCF